MGIREDILKLRDSMPDYYVGYRWAIYPDQIINIDDLLGLNKSKPVMELRVPAGMVVAPLRRYQSIERAEELGDYRG